MSSTFFSYTGSALVSKQHFLLLLICHSYANYKAQRAFVINFFISSNLLDCLRNVYTISIKTENGQSSIKVTSTIKIVTASSHFCCADVFPVRPPQNLQVQAKISTIRTVFPDYLFVSNDYGEM